MTALKKHVVLLSGTVFYIGKIPGPGGTIGSCAVYGPAALLMYSGVSETLFNGIWAVTACIAVIMSVFVGRNASKVFGKADPNEVVIDEVAGASLSLLFYPFRLEVGGIILLFFLFRFFDIVKPFGIRKLENIPDGFGIVMDDIGAGVIPLALIHISRFVVL